jgi:hypothetical protein
MSEQPIAITLPACEWELLAELLTMAEEQFENHGCNDLPDNVRAMIPPRRWREIARAILGDDDEEWQPGDSDAMSYYRDLIQAAAKKGGAK